MPFCSLLFCVFALTLFSQSQSSEADDSPVPVAPEHELYYDDHLYALGGIPDGSCNVTHFQCQQNPSNKISSFAATTPFDCCKACVNESTCVSWTHWYPSAKYDYTIGPNPTCNLFRSYANSTTNLTAGNCVTGVRYDEREFGARLNYVFYYPDTVRAESLSVYGFPLDTTPNLRQFAHGRGGVRFANHIAQHSQCTPSRTAMITGRYMHCLGHRTQAHLTEYWEPNYYRWMKDSGYYVLWLGKNDALSVESFPLTANEWHSAVGVRSGDNPYAYGEPGYYSFLRSPESVEGNSTQNGDYKAMVLLQQFLASDPPQPFSVFIPGFGGHPPYGAPKGYYDKFPPAEVEKVYTLRPPYTPKKPKYHSGEIGIPYWRNLTGFNNSFFYQIKSIYLGRMFYVDWLFGQMMESIDAYDAASNRTETAIFVSTDHGDFSGDNYLVEKWPGGLDDMLIHIPLIARLPGSAAANVTIRMPTQSFDILETMLDLAHIRREFNAFGVSLKAQLMHGTDGDLHKYVYSEGGFYYHNELYPNGTDHITSETNMYWPRAEEEMSDDGNGSPRCAMIRNAFYKLVYRPRGQSEFYDLEKDPKQTNNAWGDSAYSKMQMQMMMNLTAWYVQTGDLTPILMDPRGIPPPAPAFMAGSSSSSSRSSAEQRN